MDQINYYKVLQVDPDAEAEVIKAAYRALSRKYHPDGSHPSVERMMRLNNAYAVLSDPPARSRHNDEIERWDFTAGRAPRQPSTMPRMRYQDDGPEPPRPRRRYRPYRVSVMAQIVIISVCLLALVSSGLLRPPTSAAPPSPTPTPPAYQVDAQALQTAFEGDGFVFDTDYTRSGDLLKRGADTANVATVFIDDHSGSIRFASLLLTAREDLATAYQAEEDHALSVLLNATFGSTGGQDAARQWIEQRMDLARVDDSVVIAGWSVRMWPASEKQTGIAIRPAGQ